MRELLSPKDPEECFADGVSCQKNTIREVYRKVRFSSDQIGSCPSSEVRNQQETEGENLCQTEDASQGAVKDEQASVDVRLVEAVQSIVEEQHEGRSYSVKTAVKSQNSVLAFDKSKLCHLCHAQDEDLKTHMLEHHASAVTGGLKCNICHKIIRKKLYNFNEHLKTHSNSAHFVCSECGEGFKRAAAFRNHTEAVHSKHVRKFTG